MNSEESEFLLGSDIGTGSCKTVLADQSGRAIAVAAKEYPTLFPREGHVEQDPEAWYRAFCETTRQVIRDSGLKPASVRAICVVGVTHNPVLLDTTGSVLRPAIHFWDRRSITQVAKIRARWGEEIASRTLNEPDPLWTWPQLLWIRENEPEVWGDISIVLFPKDYVRHRLAPSLFSDTIDPAGTLLYDPRKSGWIQAFVDDLGLPLSALPQVRAPTSIAGGLSESASVDTGLPAGTVIITGTTDTAAELIGAGSVQSGQTVVKLASVGRIMMVMDRPIARPFVLNYPHLIGNLWYPGSVTKHGASAYDWLRRALWGDASDSGIFRKMDLAASETPPGSAGVFFHPHLSGEYAPQWDSELRASFVGMSVQHTRNHLTRAVLEGVAFQIGSALDQLLEAGGICHEVRLIGGGANSDLWAQIMANVLGRELLVPEQKSAAYGACLLAGMATGLYPREPERLTDQIRMSQVYVPEADLQQKYAALQKTYADISIAIAGISHRLESLSRSSPFDQIGDRIH